MNKEWNDFSEALDRLEGEDVFLFVDIVVGGQINYCRIFGTLLTLENGSRWLSGEYPHCDSEIRQEFSFSDKQVNYILEEGHEVVIGILIKEEEIKDMLLEACQELLDAIDQYGDTGWYSTPDERGVRPVLMARAAIAAATK